MKIIEKIRKATIFKKTHVRLGFSISILMGIVVSIFITFTFANRSLFSKNKHFTLKKIIINGSASWKAREKQILEYGGIRKNETNLFNIDIRALRKRIDALPSVERSSVSRKLPSTLIINISERIPRAAFNNTGKRWYADDNGVVFSASSYGEIRQDIPIIVGFSALNELNEGDLVEEFKFPATIVSTANKFYPDFIVLRLDIREKKIVIAKICRTEGSKIYTVVFPKKKIKEKFAAFKWALRKSIEENTGKMTFDLRFDGQVVTR
jgi:hypothetical protein